MVTRKLRAGKGAKASVLTRFIKPKQPLPDNNKKHRSDVVLAEKDKNSKGKDIYRFQYELETDKNAPLMYASTRYVRIVEEGHHLELFDGPGEAQEIATEEPKTKWAYSKARKLLYDDISSDVVEFDGEVPKMSLEDIYMMRQEYSEYSFTKFEDRL